ncbi:esterase family protein [Deinococcus sonorensis]|uniref:Esterase family protein n=2 Tax=Deinococcus sonorensis TaxID=309891 RepID=A0AAU7UE36_9DEIO
MAVTVEDTRVTFIPPPGAVALVGDFTDWTKRPSLPVHAGEPLQLTLPRGAWVEYAWLDAAGTPFADPDNAQRSLNPWWPYPRAVAVGEYARPALWSGPEPEQRGQAHRLSWDGGVFSGVRRAIVYTPPGYDEARTYPVYYVQDGVAFYRTGRLGELMDRALAQRLVRPAVLVFVEPGDRNEEYYLNERYLNFLTSEVWPRVEASYNVSREASGRGLWGASLGGLISLYLGSRHPELFSRVASHSGAFIAHPDGRSGSAINTTTAGEWLRAQLEAAPPHHLQVSLDTGTLEWLAAPNRRMAAALLDLGVEHQYREYQSGHNWVTWRSALPEALLYLQGGHGLPSTSP